MPPKISELEEITFHSDGLALSGSLHRPDCKRPPIVIGLHGLFSSQDSPKQIALARACNQSGIAYLRFDHRGCGRSQGDFDKVTSLTSRCRDLNCAIEMIRGWNRTSGRIGLFGSSMGGTVSLSVAAETRVEAVVTFAAPLRSDVHNRIHPSDPNSAVKPIYLDAKRSKFDLAGKIDRINNILVVHGDRDETVPVSHAREIYLLAGEPKRLIIQQNGDHRMSDRQHQDDFIREAVTWLKSGLSNEPG